MPNTSLTILHTLTFKAHYNPISRIAIFQTRTLKHRRAKEFSQGHMTRKGVALVFKGGWSSPSYSPPLPIQWNKTQDSFLDVFLLDELHHTMLSPFSNAINLVGTVS